MYLVTCIVLICEQCKRTSSKYPCIIYLFQNIYLCMVGFRLQTNALSKDFVALYITYDTVYILIGV